jgi:hypothetical protein
MEATTATNVVHPPKFAKRRRRRPTNYAIGQSRQREIVATKQQTTAAGVHGAVAVVLTALTLTHSAAGIGIMTNAPVWECWALAVGIDLGFVALELAKVLGREGTIKDVNGLLNTAIIGTLTASAIMNAFAFGHQATGWMIYPAIALGIAIPALIYCLTRVGCKMWIER